MKIMGVDPGTNIMGVAIIQDDPLMIVKLFAHNLGKRPRNDRLLDIGKIIEKYLITHNPDAVAVESQYVGINKLGSLRLAGAKDIVVVEATKRGIPVQEYAPSTIKKAVTGYGDAPKAMVARFVSAIFKSNLGNLKYDATDALAIAVCHSHRAKAEKITRREIPVPVLIQWKR
jgi:crossover junction endodeoxyribonuclease RuvC